ncbi:glycosyltransferase [Ideonella azotifigens]|uniref:Glycosyltransferase subfamily 4-like N-terminal domain-containing protein n=1 Tax=Ideonella azotifigens TaxID=513160 RepID=A0ABN1KAI8_9BURK|nr:glycosyltransferase [Ideonella azotifigens]MCD2338862.1 glycosyltransferase [Ideonella azotifigens]
MTVQRPRVLLVTFNRLMPADQGNSRRIMQLVGVYRRLGYEIDLVYHNEEGLDAGLSQAMQAEFGRVQVLASRASKRIREGHFALLSDWYDPALAQVCQEMHRLRGYQVVHVNYVWYAPLLKGFGSEVVKVLDSHDLFAERSEKYRRAGMKPSWFSTTLAEEDSAFRMADAVLAIQRGEAQEMAARGHRHVLYLPYVEAQVRPFEPPAQVPRLRLGYVGSGNDWNVRSMQAFVAALARKAPVLPFQVAVAGGICRHVREMPGLVNIGFVKELGGFYDAIDLALNPMVGGTGLKIKTVEPLSFGKPVLTTPSGAEGLAHLWTLPVLDSPEALVDYLFDTLLPDPVGCLTALHTQAVSSRAALDAEYAQQTGRFSRWLAQRVSATALASA